MKDSRRELKEYRRRAAALRRRTRANNDVCWLCHKPFDWSLPYHDAMAFTADHVVPITKGGSILGTLMPAHRRCNSRRNDGRSEERMPTTRRW